MTGLAATFYLSNVVFCFRLVFCFCFFRLRTLYEFPVRPVSVVESRVTDQRASVLDESFFIFT